MKDPEYSYSSYIKRAAFAVGVTMKAALVEKVAITYFPAFAVSSA